MTEVFFNSRIDVADLPELPPDSFEPLAPAYLRSKYVADAVTATIVAVLATVATSAVRAAEGPVWVPLAAAVVVVAMIGLAAVLQTMSVRHLGYLVREHDLTLRRGVIVRITSTIPYNRVQHVGIDRGPIERLYGLATLQLRSAGGVIGISGLTTSDANRLKELVATRAGMDQTVDNTVAPTVEQPSPAPGD
ncbi:MAG: PH domain-containing protein [Acidimicrobiia bacterium]|nr:PH domain-containing protein [Acidimicrobiia bacterium]